MPLHMTDVVVSRLKEPGTYYDEVTPAFGLRVGKNRKTWFVIRGHERLRTTIGRYPQIGLADARKEAKRLLTEEAPKVIKTIPTLSEAYEGFKESISGNKPKTQYDYKRVMDKYYVAKLGKRKLGDITYEDVDAIAKRLPKGEKRHLLAVGRTFFRWCVKPPRRYIPHSPLEGVVVPQATKRKRVLSNSELVTVWKAAREQGYPHGTVVQLLIMTGQRKTEIANLRWPWINQVERTITLPEWVTKNKKEHTFPYNGQVAAILETVPRLNSTDLLFPSRDADDRPISGWSKFKKQLDEWAETKVEGYRLHDLRRTFRTIHAEIGTSSEIGERLINHAAAVQTDVEAIYDRYKYMPEMRAAIDRYDAHISSLLARI